MQWTVEISPLGEGLTGRGRGLSPVSTLYADICNPHRPRFALLPPPEGGGQCVAITGRKPCTILPEFSPCSGP